MTTSDPPAPNNLSHNKIGLRIFRDQVLLISRVTAVWDFRATGALFGEIATEGYGR
jgi:hypothetical protein